MGRCESPSAGHEVAVLSRASGTDLMTGEGLDAGLDGAQAVIDVSNRSTTKSAEALDFFSTVTGNLTAAARRAAIGHYVVLSIIGVDRIPWGYHQAKLRQEQLALESGLPVSVLRAAQFHEFPGQVMSAFGGPVAVVPAMRTQPLAAREAGAAVARLAVGPVVGRAPVLAGPREEYLPDLARRLLTAQHRRRLVIGLRLPGAAGRALARGGALPADDDGTVQHAVQTFDDWLADQVDRAARP
jgi:uncharacterized protein YbjT (DUF2867 family)